MDDLDSEGGYHPIEELRNSVWTPVDLSSHHKPEVVYYSQQARKERSGGRGHLLWLMLHGN